MKKHFITISLFAVLPLAFIMLQARTHSINSTSIQAQANSDRCIQEIIIPYGGTMPDEEVDDSLPQCSGCSWGSTPTCINFDTCAKCENGEAKRLTASDHASCSACDHTNTQCTKPDGKKVDQGFEGWYNGINSTCVRCNAGTLVQIDKNICLEPTPTPTPRATVTPKATIRPTKIPKITISPTIPPIAGARCYHVGYKCISNKQVYCTDIGKINTRGENGRVVTKNTNPCLPKQQSDGTYISGCDPETNKCRTSSATTSTPTPVPNTQYNTACSYHDPLSGLRKPLSNGPRCSGGVSITCTNGKITHTDVCPSNGRICGDDGTCSDLTTPTPAPVVLGSCTFAQRNYEKCDSQDEKVIYKCNYSVLNPISNAFDWEKSTCPGDKVCKKSGTSASCEDPPTPPAPKPDALCVNMIPGVKKCTSSGDVYSCNIQGKASIDPCDNGCYESGTMAYCKDPEPSFAPTVSPVATVTPSITISASPTPATSTFGSCTFSKYGDKKCSGDKDYYKCRVNNEWSTNYFDWEYEDSCSGDQTCEQDGTNIECVGSIGLLSPTPTPSPTPVASTSLGSCTIFMDGSKKCSDNNSDYYKCTLTDFWSTNPYNWRHEGSCDDNETCQQNGRSVSCATETVELPPTQIAECSLCHPQAKYIRIIWDQDKSLSCESGNALPGTVNTKLDCSCTNGSIPPTLDVSACTNPVTICSQNAFSEPGRYQGCSSSSPACIAAGGEPRGDDCEILGTDNTNTDTKQCCSYPKQ